MPFHLRILSHTVTVKQIKPGPFAEEKQYGSAEYGKAEICILEGMHPDAFAQTLLHEIVHIIEDAQGVRFEEHEVEALATGFFTLLKDNPEFVDTYINPGNATE